MSEDKDLLRPIKVGVLAGRAKKALDVIVLDLREVASFTDYFVLMTGNTPRQVTAIADEVVARLRVEENQRPTHVEGMAQGEWVVLDYTDFIIHVFTPGKRGFYRLEQLWQDAAPVELPEAAA